MLGNVQVDAGRLVQQAEAALQRRDPRSALELLSQAEASAVGPILEKLYMTRALALRMQGDLAGAVAALDGALAIEPYNFLALLSKGALFERLTGQKQAARIYRNALKIAPPPDRIPPGLTAPLARAREVVQADQDAQHAFLRERTQALRAEASGDALARFDESMEVFTGKARIRHQEPLLFHYPRLPAIPFYPRELFPWLPELEAATPMIQQELASALEQISDRFVPYIQYPPGAPVNQWGELNHSKRWSSLFLWKDGARQDAACAKCPQTAALLESLPMAHQRDYAPTAVFSALEPHTHIPPHTGSANTRLLVHLPLILPGPARFRVGNETREWKLGHAWVFDDTLEHEAWNDADQLRVILIFDIWNPYLTPAERELVTAMLAANKEYYGETA